MSEVIEKTERAVVGAMMANPSSAALALERLSAEDFEDDTYRSVFLAVSDVMSSGGAVDPVQVADQMAAAGTLPEGGHLDLHRLISSIPSQTQVKSYVSRLVDFATRRRFANAGRTMTAAANDLERPTGTLAEAAVDALVGAVVGREDESGIVTFDVDEFCQWVEDEPDDGGASTGWVNLDSFYTVGRGQMTVVTGHPYHGKSSWTLSLAVNLAVEHDWRFVIWSPEHTRKRLLGKLIERRLGKAVRYKERFGRRSSLASPEEVREAGEWVKDRFKLLAPRNVESWTVSTLVGLSQVLMRVWPFQGLILDPWTELTIRPPEGLSETSFIGEELAKVRQFAIVNEAHAWVVAHPTKAVDEAKVPQLQHVSGSANFHRKTDCGVAVWRDAKQSSNRVEIHVLKVREDAFGRAGECEMTFDPTSGRFTESTPV